MSTSEIILVSSVQPFTRVHPQIANVLEREGEGEASLHPWISTYLLTLKYSRGGEEEGPGGEKRWASTGRSVDGSGGGADNGQPVRRTKKTLLGLVR